MKKQWLSSIRVLILFLLVSCTDIDGSNPGVYNDVYIPGVYSGEASSYGGILKVRSTFSQTAITGVEIIEHHDTNTRGPVSDALRIIPQKIALKGSSDVDTVSGASITSNRILDAVEDSAEQARIIKTFEEPNSYQFINNSAFTLAVTAEDALFELRPGAKKTITFSGVFAYTYTVTGGFSVTPQVTPGKIIFKNN
jgi:uncharacterized protein with FMN-binding domain